MKAEHDVQPQAHATAGIPGLTVQAPAARLGVAVVRQLADVVVTGTLKPGDLLPPEALLASQFGVSRTVVRESVKRLEEKGLVTVAQGFGTRVTEPTNWNLLDPVVLSAMIEHDDALGVLDELSKVRAGLESMMAAEAAGKVLPNELESLNSILDEMRAAVEDHDRFVAADRDFHALVMQISGNRLAPSIARTLFNRASESSRFHGVDPEDALRVTLTAHEQVYEAIKNSDPAAAGEAMFDHIQGSWQSRRLPSADR